MQKILLPKKKLLDRARESGAIDEASHLMSGAYLMAALLFSFADDADTTLRKYGLLLGPLKQKFTAVYRAYDLLAADFQQMVRASGQETNFAEDFDTMKAAVLAALGMTSGIVGKQFFVTDVTCGTYHTKRQLELFNAFLPIKHHVLANTPNDLLAKVSMAAEQLNAQCPKKKPFIVMSDGNDIKVSCGKSLALHIHIVEIKVRHKRKVDIDEDSNG